MRLFALSITVLTTLVLGGLQGSVAHAAAPAETNTKAKTVEIQPGDSLSKIAESNGSTIQRLYDANTKIENPDLIYPKDQLRVPAKDEKLTSRPLPAESVAAQEATPSTPTQRPAKTTASAPAVAGGSVWDQLAQCEAGGNWAANTGNGYYGGLQFNLSSWQAVGGSGLPSDASRDEQIMRGQMLQSRQGWGAWPACSAKLGLS